MREITDTMNLPSSHASTEARLEVLRARLPGCTPRERAGIETAIALLEESLKLGKDSPK